MPANNWHILGFGSMGGLLAAQLSHLTPIRLILKQPPAEYMARPNQQLQVQFNPFQENSKNILLNWELAGHPSPINNLIIATKSYHAEAALLSILPRLNPESNIFLVQNGLGSHFRLAEQFPNLQLYAVTTTEGANLKTGDAGTPNIITHAGKGETRIGRLTRTQQEPSPILVSLIKQSGLETSITANIWKALWQKLTINCGINPYTALLDCPNGNILSSDLFKKTIKPLCNELSAAISHAGFTESAESIEDKIRKVASLTKNNISSMLQDVRANRQTEIGDINGFICEYGIRNKLPFETNQYLTQQLSKLSH